MEEMKLGKDSWRITSKWSIWIWFQWNYEKQWFIISHRDSN